MKLPALLVIFSCLFQAWVFSQDTFSIVAIDTTTGEVGSAGASCIDASAIAGGVLIISDILPGRGGIHTQSYWLPANQVNAHARMEAGDTPQQIMDWLQANDVQGTSGIRQYGAVAFGDQGQPQAAAFTGASCLDYKNHIVGNTYAIQGNILLGQQILDSMEARFLNTDGPLAVKLMAALQGANVPGADSRCLADGVSSLSSFIRVAKPEDEAGNFYLDLNVPIVPAGVEPIDSLQTLFDAWLATGAGEKVDNQPLAKVFPNPARHGLTVAWHPKNKEAAVVALSDLSGRKILEQPIVAGLNHLALPEETRGKVLVLHIRGERGAVLFSEKIAVQE